MQIHMKQLFLRRQKEVPLPLIQMLQEQILESLEITSAILDGSQIQKFYNFFILTSCTIEKLPNLFLESRLFKISDPTKVEEILEKEEEGSFAVYLNKVISWKFLCLTRIREGELHFPWFLQ
jgi:hypothetical protein